MCPVLFFINWGFKTKQNILGDFLKKLTYCNYVQIIFKWTCYMPWHSKKIFLWLPFKSMTYETKENTFVFTIWRKKVLLTDIFHCSVFFSPIEKNEISNLLMAIIPLIFNFTLCVKPLFIMNFYAIFKNTNEIFLPFIV